jgi:tetratricopeptide (TPR) repeat protein
MTRLLTGVLLSVVAGATAISQSKPVPAPDQKAGSAQMADWNLDKPAVLRLIALNEAEARDEATRADRKRLVMIYSNLGILYADAGMFLKAEDAVRRAIALLKNGPQDQLADQTEQLAVVHLAMSKMPQAEKEEKRALQIREAVGDPVGTALSESALAGLYGAERKSTKSLDYAERAYAVLAEHAGVSVADRVGVRHTLGFALTSTHHCDRGIGILEDALALTKINPGAGTMSPGYSEYLLGFGYWQCGDQNHAAEWLERGTTDMRGAYGWGHVMYVNAMKQYAQFLRESGQQQAAASAEAVVHQAETVVDASSLTGRSEGFRSAGSK